METKTVVAGDHGPVPMEENARRYITDEPVEVPLTTYYVRRLMSGELREVEGMRPVVKGETLRASLPHEPATSPPMPIPHHEEGK